MAHFKKNIWMLYRFLVLFSTGLFLFTIWQQFLNVDKLHKDEQYNAIELFSSGTQSLLDNQEMMLDMIAERLLLETDMATSAKERWLASLLELNSNISAFGLVSPEGDVLLTSSNIDSQSQSNLLKQKHTRDSFLDAVNSYKMVVGRSYYKNDLDQVMMPVRKAIRNDHGETIAVMTAGLKLDQSSLFNIDLHGHNEQLIGLLRSDYYYQYVTGKDAPVTYADLLDSDEVNAVLENIAVTNGLSLKQVKSSSSPVTANMGYRNQFGLEPTTTTVKFLPRYNMWAFAQISRSHIWYEFVVSIIPYIAVFIVLQAVFYLSIRSIHRNETLRVEELLYQAHHDPLTGLPNRHFLRDKQHRWFGDKRAPFTLLYIDMDHYKRVNDSAGHETGDKVLNQIALRIEGEIESDMVLIRESGDEFVVIIPDAYKDRIEDYAKNILSTLAQPYYVDKFSFILGCSIGITQYPKQGKTLDELLRCADIAMYQAKEKRNAHAFFTPTLQQAYLKEIQIEQKLRRAIAKKELYLAYQPQLNRKGELHGVEALVRWEDKELGFVPPDQFIPIAESCGMMPELGDLVLEIALSDMKGLQTELNYRFHTAINISVRQIVQRDFLEKLLKTLKATNYENNYLTLELTENLFIEDLESVKPLFNQLAELGIRISLDDFGTGYSSLSMLGELPFDEIKIDKSFIDEILTDEKALRMVQNIISIAKNFDREVVAEGVECEGHVHQLRMFDCDLYQGYYYAKPMTLPQLRAVLFQHLVRQPNVTDAPPNARPQA
ncbi:EAL domain-containing protein [Vibrio sp. SCSIO 43136]|uniref:bifunctional diguanylate cyclase/phosphodiesterase n=1 Tax=Vibrio sp. SCSIO 43136 TaxID=2819101 RepID=UPI002074BC2E|nr:EAL domain-containing protein [Vibrio sp. SCSIO 43136]USD67951.1 EAL domain-containing protein [Vibrio sp. SCSIO 43136]